MGRPGVAGSREVNPRGDPTVASGASLGPRRSCPRSLWGRYPADFIDPSASVCYDARLSKAARDLAQWASLYSTKSYPFEPPASGRIAVKVINHYGDEVLKVYKV